MFDPYNRNIHYLRISVTDRCNLRCRYCMPEDGIKLVQHNDILSFEEIIEVVEQAVELGIDKIRLTGGEPTVRKGIVDLVRKIALIKGVKDLALTTNGILLESLAKPLKEAGLKRVNISLDTINPEKFREITRGGYIGKIILGIRAAKAAGLNPIKINCVVVNSSNEADALEVKEFCIRNNLQVRFIRQMDLETGVFSEVEGGLGGNCHECNRIRLTANGMVKPCLFDEQEYPVRELGAREALIRAIETKPLNGCFNRVGSFYSIGG
jgi:cyclic pyranopterin phosphate synthase